MNPANIITATAMILIASSLLSGCKIETPETAVNGNQTSSAEAVPTVSAELSAETQAQIQKAETIKKEVQLVFETEQNGNELKVRIILENPSQKPVSSVQSWISYDPAKLIGKSIDTSRSSFLLMAPYPNTFDAENGLAMIGRSHPKPLTDTRLMVAEAQFEINASGPITLEAYDYRDDLNGHTSANILIDGKVYNLLTKPDTPAVIIQNQ